jgi:hypothetical protein
MVNLRSHLIKFAILTLFQYSTSLLENRCNRMAHVPKAYPCHWSGKNARVQKQNVLLILMIPSNAYLDVP